MIRFDKKIHIKYSVLALLLSFLTFNISENVKASPGVQVYSKSPNVKASPKKAQVYSGSPYNDNKNYIPLTPSRAAPTIASPVTPHVASSLTSISTEEENIEDQTSCLSTSIWALTLPITIPARVTYTIVTAPFRFYRWLFYGRSTPTIVVEKENPTEEEGKEEIVEDFIKKEEEKKEKTEKTPINNSNFSSSSEKSLKRI